MVSETNAELKSWSFDDRGVLCVTFADGRTESVECRSAADGLGKLLARKASDDERVVEAAEELISVIGGNCFDSGYAPRKHAAWAVLKRTVADYRTQRGG